MTVFWWQKLGKVAFSLDIGEGMVYNVGDNVGSKRERAGKLMYRYETHLHTWPVSACASASPRETVEFYHSLGYDGIFITNHFKGGNTTPGHEASHEEFMRFYLADYEEAKKVGRELGIKVFFGVEISYAGTDFLIYGLTPEWYCAHPEICEVRMSQCLKMMIDEGAPVPRGTLYRPPPSFSKMSSRRGDIQRVKDRLRKRYGRAVRQKLLARRLCRL